MNPTTRTLEVFKLGHPNPFLDLRNYDKDSNPEVSRQRQSVIHSEKIRTCGLEPHELEQQDAAGLESAKRVAEFTLGQELMRRSSPIDFPKTAREVPHVYATAMQIRVKVDFQWVEIPINKYDNPDGCKWFGRTHITYSLGDTKPKGGFLARRPKTVDYNCTCK